MSSDLSELTVISKILTEEYLNERLTDWFGKEVKYVKHEFGDETTKGDSYLSDVYRITFHARIVSPEPNEEPDVNAKIIIKCLPKNIARRRTFRSVDFFKNEISFYLDVLPELLKFQATKKMTSPFDNSPRIFATVTDGENDFLAMEDLSIYNFGSAARQEGIDYEHFKIILECFAKLHAMSFAYNDQHPEKYAELTTKVFEVYYHDRYWNWFKKFWKSICACAIDAIEQEYPGTIYEKKIKEFATDEAYVNQSKAASTGGKTAVFSHGDSWAPNFLFKYKPGTIIPEEAKMIDFQLTRCASPILDISFFIYACSTEDIRKEYYQSMLKHYHDILTTQIREMGSDPDKVYPWSLFMKEVKQYSFFGLAFSFESTPVSVFEPEDIFDMEAVQGTEPVELTEIWIIKPIKKQAGRLRLAGNIVHAVDNGFI